MIYIGTDEGIYRWITRTFWPAYHSLQERAVVSLASPGAGLLAVVDGDGRVWESDNNGLDWTEIPAPLGAGRPVSVALGGASGAFVVATKPMGLYRRVVGAPLPPRPVADVETRPTVVRTWLAKASSASTALLSRPKPRRAEDEAGWTALASPPVAADNGRGYAPAIRTLVIAPGESAPWFAAVTGHGLWRSDDGAASWEPCAGLPQDVYAVRAVARPTELVAAATSDGCWISTDLGKTWEPRNGGLDKVPQLRALEINPDDPNVMLAGAAPAGGTEPAPGTTRRGTRFALYETSDGGKSWMKVRRGFPDELEYDAITDIRFDPDDTDNCIVALESGELWRTRNGGEWWEPIARQTRAARILCAVP